MKKIMTLAAMFAAVAMTFSACNKEQKPDNGGENNGGENTENVCPDCGEDPCVCEPADDYVAPITIDGNFADWDALTGAITLTCAADANWTALKSVKVYADGKFMYVLMDVDADEISGDAPIDMYLNVDNDESEYSNNFLGEAAMDYLIEGAYYVGADEEAGTAAEVVSFDPGIFAYGGTPDAACVWAFDSILDGGFSVGAGTIAKYEFALDMLKLADEASVEWGDSFGFGITVSQSWEPVGLLPNVTPTDDNGKGSAQFATITINK